MVMEVKEILLKLCDYDEMQVLDFVLEGIRFIQRGGESENNLKRIEELVNSSSFFVLKEVICLVYNKEGV